MECFTYEISSLHLTYIFAERNQCQEHWFDVMFWVRKLKVKCAAEQEYTCLRDSQHINETLQLVLSHIMKGVDEGRKNGGGEREKEGGKILIMLRESSEETSLSQRAPVLSSW